ncbi:hypothetical protein [Sphaerisporangium flaviroseum]
MAELNLFEAWQLWMSGESMIDHTLFELPMIWWGRAGKIVSFLAGMTVVLDVIGPERLREFSTRFRRINVDRARSMRIGRRIVVGLLVTVAAVAVTSEIVGDQDMEEIASVIALGVGIFGLIVVPAAAGFLAGGVAGLLENPRTERLVRWIGVILLVVGFHFDLLAS